jgi:hypothetical protein
MVLLIASWHLVFYAIMVILSLAFLSAVFITRHESRDEFNHIVSSFARCFSAGNVNANQRKRFVTAAHGLAMAMGIVVLVVVAVSLLFEDSAHQTTLAFVGYKGDFGVCLLLLVATWIFVSKFPEQRLKYYAATLANILQFFVVSYVIYLLVLNTGGFRESNFTALMFTLCTIVLIILPIERAVAVSSFCILIGLSLVLCFKDDQPNEKPDITVLVMNLLPFTMATFYKFVFKEDPITAPSKLLTVRPLQEMTSIEQQEINAIINNGAEGKQDAVGQQGSAV